jgi:hypothetical protein
MPSDKTRAMVRSALQRDGWIEGGGVGAHHINSAEYQAGGRPSKTGGVYGSESQIGRRHIDKQNRRVWPHGAAVSAAHKGPVGRKGGVSGSNGNGPANTWYSAGPGRSRG